LKEVIRLDLITPAARRYRVKDPVWDKDRYLHHVYVSAPEQHCSH